MFIYFAKLRFDVVSVTKDDRKNEMQAKIDSITNAFGSVGATVFLLPLKDDEGTAIKLLVIDVILRDYNRANH